MTQPPLFISLILVIINFLLIMTCIYYAIKLKKMYDKRAEYIENMRKELKKLLK